MTSALALRPESGLRRRICRATSDGAMAHAIYSLALTSRWGKRAFRRPGEPIQLPLPHGAGEFSDEVLAYAHDLAVHLAFLGPNQAERACHLLGPATWRLVQRLGGWERLHRLPAIVRARGLPVRIHRALGELGPRTLPRALSRKRLDTAQADRLLEAWRPHLPALGPGDAGRLVRAHLSLGSATLLLDRLAAAVEEGVLPAERASVALGRLCERCPAVT